LSEHAAKLSKLLGETLQRIESAKEESVPVSLVKSLIVAVYALTTKVEGAPDYNAVIKAVASIHEDLKSTTTTTQTTATTVMDALTTIHGDIKTAALSITKGVAEVGKEAAVVLQETRDIAKAIRSTPTPKSSYASVLSSNIAPSSKPITIPTQTPSLIQAQREIVVKITNPTTIESLRAKNPRILQSHVDRAIEQSQNKHIESIRVASANQLKSGDLSIKTINITEAEALKQFADDWSSRIGNGASVRVPTYGIIAHGIRTKSMDMAEFERVKDELMKDNKPFIPLAEIKY
ncbi:hypothetical protein BJ875DRAFT_349433, partial [Amylocarpus encephaloides]